MEEVMAALRRKFDPCTSYRELSSSTRHKTTRIGEGLQAACGDTRCCDDNHYSTWSIAHCSKVSYRTFLSGKLPVFIVTAPNFKNMSEIPLSLMGYLGIHLK